MVDLLKVCHFRVENIERVAASERGTQTEQEFKDQPEVAYSDPSDSTLLNYSTPETDKLSHSQDYCSVNLNGEKFYFTSRQAEVVQFLHENYKNGTPDVTMAYIITNLFNNELNTFRQIFQGNENWKKLIVSGKRKGSVRLNLK